MCIKSKKTTINTVHWERPNSLVSSWKTADCCQSLLAVPEIDKWRWPRFSRNKWYLVVEGTRLATPPATCHADMDLLPPNMVSLCSARSSRSRRSWCTLSIPISSHLTVDTPTSSVHPGLSFLQANHVQVTIFQRRSSSIPQISFNNSWNTEFDRIYTRKYSHYWFYIH